MKLRTLLQGCSSGQLNRISAAWKLEIEAGTLRRELVELLAVQLEQTGQGAAAWTSLSEREQKIIAALVRAGGRHDIDLLTRRLVGAGTSERVREAAASAVQTTVAGLLDRGIVFRIFESEAQRQGVYLVLADELLSSAGSHLTVLGSFPLPSPVDPPSEVARCNIADDLFVLASALRREAWSAPSRGLAGRPARSVGQILSRLQVTPRPGPGRPGQRWRFLLWLAQRAGWINRAPLPQPDDDALNRLLREPGALPGRALAAGPARPESSPTRTQSPQPARPRNFQADVLQLLNELPDSDWWVSDDLATWLIGQLSDRAVPDAGRTARPEQAVRTVLRWLSGRWYWLGLVEWGRTPAGWHSVRPTPALRLFVTGRSGNDTPQGAALCMTEDSLVLVAPAGADLAALYRTEPYLAYAVSEADARHYRLTPPSLERGLRLGGSPEALMLLVAQLTGQPVPHDWSASIERWTSESGRLRLSAGLILSSDDEQVLAKALALPSALESVVEVVSPTQARVAGERLATMLTDLAAAGLPVDIDPGVRAEPSHAGRAAALSGSAAEAAWIGMEIARRLAPEIIDGQRDLTAARLQLEAIFSAARLETLERRVASIMALSGERKRPVSRRRVV